MNVIDMMLKIFFASYFVLPKSSLPNCAFTVTDFGFGYKFTSFKFVFYTLCEFCFYHPYPF